MKSMLATLAGDMLIRVETGYVPVLPAVAGDGGVYVPTRPGGLAVPPPGQPATEVSVRQLTPEGLELVMNRAAELRLLGTPPYTAEVDGSAETVLVTPAFPWEC